VNGRLSWLVKGLPGHPLHPPLTDATIGAYTFAFGAGLVNVLGWVDRPAAQAWWLALVGGLIFTVPTALTGLVEWLSISSGTPLWRTATAHLVAMVTASVVFLAAALAGHGDYANGIVGGGAFALTVLAWAAMLFGGWIGGAIVYVHGMRVLELPGEPAKRAISPLPHEEKVAAEN